MYDLEKIGVLAKSAAKALRRMSAAEKNRVLLACADALEKQASFILEENAKDVEAASGQISAAMLDRLTLTEERIADMASGLRKLAALPDPVGEVTEMKTMPNGLKIGQQRVPMGVIGIIYEARPNVTSDAFGICIKAGSAVILRGGKEAINTNSSIVKVFCNSAGLPDGAVQLITDTSREVAREFMRLKKYVDLLIPRGGYGLIQSVVENSTVPVIETGAGICHIFVDESAKLDNAVKIIINAKVQRPSVCNSCETVLVHVKIAEKLLPGLCAELSAQGVEIRGDEAVRAVVGSANSATEEDWATEYNDYILSIKVVEDMDAALEHIERYSTGHSEAILTESYSNAQRFLDEADSAAVYVNASTRFTDGEQFGLGAEIGISTQKLHARGPMGLKEITTTKYFIYGSGQVRE